MIYLDRESSLSLTEQLVSQLAGLIQGGQLPPGSRLPSIRKQAAASGVSIATVVAAYDRLVARGLIESRAASGYFICPRRTSPGRLPTPLSPRSEMDAVWLMRRMLSSDPALAAVGSGYMPEHWLEDMLSSRVLARFARQGKACYASAGAVEGFAPLRQRIALKLAMAGVPASAENLLMTFGATQGIDLICRGLLSPGDTVAVEEPGYFGLFAQLRAHGVKLVGIPRRDDGPDLAVLEEVCVAYRPRLLFTQTLMHNPTGGSSSPATVFGLLELARRHGLLLVEDDVFGDFHPAANPLRLAQVDAWQRVIYLGSFSKVLSPSIRVGFIAAAPELIEVFLEHKLLSVFTSSELDWEEALLLCLTAGLLGLFRPAFYRPSRLLELPFGPLDLTASVCVLGAATWLMFFTFRDVPYSHALWWQFAVDAHAPRALRAALGSGVLMALLGLLHLLRPAPAPIRAPDAAERERARAIVQASRQPEGGLALSGDKALLFRPQGDGFLMYARQGRSLVALFDPVGPADARAELVWQFRDLCDRHHSRPVFYQVRAENLPAYVDAGLSAVKLGEEAIVELERFDLDSPGMKDLRYAWNRGQRDGLRLTLHDAGSVPLEALREISDAWMAGKPGREKGFSLGRFDPDYLRHFRIALVTVGERPVAFANLLETGVPDTATLDLMRLHPEAPKLTMEFLMLGLIQQFKASGYRRFSLGMVPLSGLRPRRGAPLALRMGALLFKRGERFYNFKGLRRFKEKFQPHWEPRYLAVPTGTDPLLALADVATLIAGGYGGLIGR